MSGIYSWIKNIVIYMILSSIISNLIGNSSYKKYVGVVSGMLLVLIIIAPITSLLNIDEKIDFLFDLNQFAIETSEFKSSLDIMEENQKQEIFHDFSKQIEGQVQELLLADGVDLKECHIVIDEDVDSENFANIISMVIKGDYKENQSDIKQYNKKSISKVETVKIDKIGVKPVEEDSENGSEREEKFSPVENKIKDKLSDFYNIDSYNININIQGG